MCKVSYFSLNLEFVIILLASWTRTAKLVDHLILSNLLYHLWLWRCWLMPDLYTDLHLVKVSIWLRSLVLERLLNCWQLDLPILHIVVHIYIWPGYLSRRRSGTSDGTKLLLYRRIVTEFLSYDVRTGSALIHWFEVVPDGRLIHLDRSWLLMIRLEACICILLNNERRNVWQVSLLYRAG